ncbi:MAG: TonB-dependent receptor [Siphonobacter sp.]
MEKKYQTAFGIVRKRYIIPKWMLSTLLLALASPLTYAAGPVTKSQTLRIKDTVVDRIITGIVTAQDSKEGLPGVTVQIKGTNVGTTTDAQGRYRLSIPDQQSVVVFSFIGYTTIEQPITTQTTVNVELAAHSKDLTEVLVVGYGTQSKKEFTGSAASISSEKLKEIPVQSFEQALAGRAAGVNISVANGVLNNAPVIRVRGINSISLSSYPLIVVDGIPLTTGNVGNSNVTNNPLGDINPSDIESIDVLKDAASTAIYGSRAAAGVLLITTKRGKEGRVKVGYDGWVGVTSAVRLPELLHAEDYMMIKNEAVMNKKVIEGNANNSSIAGELFFPTYRSDGSLVDTRWYDYMFQTGVSQNHAVNVSGGNKTTSYFFSTNYSDQNGFLQTNNFKRKGIRLNLDHQATKWLKVRGNLNYTNSYNKAPNSGSLEGNAQLIVGAARMAYTLAPNVPAYNEDGTPHLNLAVAGGPIGNGNNQVTSVYYNPVALFKLASYTSENDRILANIGATVTLFKGLDFTTNYSIDRLRTENINSTSAEPGGGSSTNGSVTNITGLRNNWNFTNTLNYDVRFGKNHLTALLGYDAQIFNTNVWGVYVTQAADPYFDDYQGTWGNITPSGNSLFSRSFLSMFSRVTYDFNDKYFFTVNFRRDGNSSLGADKKWGNFGGISAGWSLSEEDFYKTSEISRVLNSVKLRASWGRVGNGNLNSPYASLNLYSSSLYSTVPTWAISQAGNPNLGWETSEQTNVGADLGLWNNKVQLELTYFNNNVNGLILSVPQSPSKGIPGDAILANVGSLYNRGLELGINTTVIRKKDFSWNISFNYTHLTNKVTSLAGEGDKILSTTSSSANIFNVTQVGLPVGTLYGAITDGINPENGQRIYLNAAGEKVQYSLAIAPDKGSSWTYLDGTPATAISAADYKPMGNALPKWYGGFNNTFRYKNFDVNLNFSYSGGNYILNGNTGTWLDQRYFNNSRKVLNRWTTPGQITDVPRLVYGDNFASANIPNISAYVEKGDFVRLQNVVVGYKLPSALFGQSGISSLRVYAQATNVFLFTKYTGVEPESSVNGNTNTSPGVEYNSLGNGRTITLGVNLAF